MNWMSGFLEAEISNQNGSNITESGSAALTTKDPNQIEMGFDEKKEKRNEVKNEAEIVIEFPLKSRRTIRQAQGKK